MDSPRTLLLTDIVDSTALAARLGAEATAALWAAHDAMARALVRAWRGREVGRSDGFLLLFEHPSDALGFAFAYHAALVALPTPLQARVGLHAGPVRLRENSALDRSLGATPFEVDGIALPLAARVGALALGGQTLATLDALAAVPPEACFRRHFGHWRLQGIDAPIELYGVTPSAASPGPGPPPDAAKAYRVSRQGDTWVPVREIANNLPAERDAFFGRNELLRDIAERFTAGARLVTLQAIGGIGKTRAALRFARAYLGDYPGGAWFCDLAQVTTLDGINHALARALELPLAGADPVAHLGAALRGRGRCLVVLDNFEQVVSAAEPSVGRWMAAAPQVDFLVTSREQLGIAGEQVLPVAPLGQADAIALFLARAASAGANAASIGVQRELAALVDTLDRLPLAIELAAARTVLMTPADMLARIKDRFKLLASAGGRLDRQATLRATIDWSWDLLEAAERQALAQLSVFEGGFDLRAAEAVIDLSTCSPAPWAGDVLHALLRKSLLRRTAANRFEMLRSVQDYAAERLATLGDVAGGQRGAMQRHWRHFATFSEADATAARCADTDNLLAACQRAAATEPAQAVATLNAAWAALQRVGPFRAVLPLVEAIEANPLALERTDCTIDRVMGGALYLLGHTDGARERWTSCLARAKAAHDTDTQVLAICQLAELHMSHGDYPAAEAALESALPPARTSPDRGVLIRTLNHLGTLRLELSQWDRAQGDTDEALALAEQIGDRRWMGGLHGNLGTIAHSQGRLAEARGHYEAALSMAQDVGDRQWEGNNRCNLGLLLHEIGNDAAARAELEQSLQLARSFGYVRLEATVRCNLGIVIEALGDRAGAARCYEESVAAARVLGDPRIEAQFRGYWGLCLARQGAAAEAESCLQQAINLLQGLDDPLSLGVVECQHAISAALAGNRTGWQLALASAESLLMPLGLGADAEASRLLAEARSAGLTGC